MKLTKYILKNCPCLVNSLYADGREVPYECGFSCADIRCWENDACKLRELTDGALLEYMTPEQTMLSEREDNRETHLLNCAKHNMAVMIMSKLGYEEVEE